MPRLIICHVCHTITRMPDVPADMPLVPFVLEYTTGERYMPTDPETGMNVMVPKYDPMLEEFVSRHEHNLPDQAVTHGQQIESVQVDQKTWDAMDVVTQIQSELQRTTGEVYAENQQHREDAIKCYNEHGNPDITTGCRDYLDDSKLIGRWNYKDDDGKDVVIPPKFRQYLCYMCPYQHAYVQVELRRRRGMYKEGMTPRQVRHAKKQRK